MSVLALYLVLYAHEPLLVDTHIGLFGDIQSLLGRDREGGREGGRDRERGELVGGERKEEVIGSV